MKAILLFVVAGLFVGCSSDDNPASSADNVIIGLWQVEGFSYGSIDKQVGGPSKVEYRADGTTDIRNEDSKLITYTWKIKDGIITHTDITGERGVFYGEIEITSNDVWVYTQTSTLDDGTNWHSVGKKYVYRRVVEDR